MGPIQREKDLWAFAMQIRALVLVRANDELQDVGASAHMSQSQHNAGHPTDELHDVGASAHMSQSQHNASRLTDKLHEVSASAMQKKLKAHHNQN